MEEVKFRAIDNFMIKMTLRGKLYLISGVPLTFYVMTILYFNLSSSPSETVLYAIVGTGMVLTLVTAHYVTTFVGGALYSLNNTMGQVSDGDLTIRLNFLPAPDEFSTTAINLDKMTGRTHDLVQIISDANTKLDEVAKSLNDQGTNTANYSVKQREQIEALASAIEQMRKQKLDLMTGPGMAQQRRPKGTLWASVLLALEVPAILASH